MACINTLLPDCTLFPGGLHHFLYILHTACLFLSCLKEIRQNKGIKISRSKGEETFTIRNSKDCQITTKKIKLFKASYLAGFTNVFIENINSEVERQSNNILSNLE